MANLAICSECEDAFCDECDPLIQCAGVGFHCDGCALDCLACQQAYRDEFNGAR